MVRKIAASITLQARPGAGEALAAHLADLGQTLARRAGTELWLVLRDEAAPDRLAIWEVFASAESRAAHYAAPEYAPGWATAEAMLAAPAEVATLVPFAGKGLVAPQT
jgi:quinol monooxygenase YgiN